MALEEGDPDVLKSNVLDLLLRNPLGLSFGDFAGAFHRLHGYQLKITRHGYSSLKQFLAEMKDFVVVEEGDSQVPVVKLANGFHLGHGAEGRENGVDISGGPALRLTDEEDPGGETGVLGLLFSVLKRYQWGLRIKKLQKLFLASDGIDLEKLSVRGGYADTLEFLEQRMPNLNITYQQNRLNCVVQLIEDPSAPSSSVSTENLVEEPASQAPDLSAALVPIWEVLKCHTPGLKVKNLKKALLENCGFDLEMFRRDLGYSDTVSCLQDVPGLILRNSNRTRNCVVQLESRPSSSAPSLDSDFSVCSSHTTTDGLMRNKSGSPSPVPSLDDGFSACNSNSVPQTLMGKKSDLAAALVPILDVLGNHPAGLNIKALKENLEKKHGFDLETFSQDLGYEDVTSCLLDVPGLRYSFTNGKWPHNCLVQLLSGSLGLPPVSFGAGPSSVLVPSSKGSNTLSPDLMETKPASCTSTVPQSCASAPLNMQRPAGKSKPVNQNVLKKKPASLTDVLASLTNLISTYSEGLRVEKVQELLLARKRIDLEKFSIAQGHKDTLEFLERQMPNLNIRYREERRKCVVSIGSGKSKTKKKKKKKTAKCPGVKTAPPLLVAPVPLLHPAKVVQQANCAPDFGGIYKPSFNICNPSGNKSQNWGPPVPTAFVSPGVQNWLNNSSMHVPSATFPFFPPSQEPRGALSGKAKNSFQPPSSILPHQAPPSGILPRQAPPSGILPHQAPPSGILPRQAPPAGILPHQAPPAGILPHQAPPSGILPHQAPPSGILPHQAPPSGILPHQAPPSGIHPHQAPPSGILPHQAPPSGILLHQPSAWQSGGPSPLAKEVHSRDNQLPRESNLMNSQPSKDLEELKKRVAHILAMHPEGMSLFQFRAAYSAAYQQHLPLDNASSAKQCLLEMPDIVRLEGCGVQTLVLPVSAKVSPVKSNQPVPSEVENAAVAPCHSLPQTMAAAEPVVGPKPAPLPKAPGVPQPHSTFLRASEPLEKEDDKESCILPKGHLKEIPKTVPLLQEHEHKRATANSRDLSGHPDLPKVQDSAVTSGHSPPKNKPLVVPKFSRKTALRKPTSLPPPQPHLSLRQPSECLGPPANKEISTLPGTPKPVAPGGEMTLKLIDTPNSPVVYPVDSQATRRDENLKPDSMVSRPADLVNHWFFNNDTPPPPSIFQPVSTSPGAWTQPVVYPPATFIPEMPPLYPAPFLPVSVRPSGIQFQKTAPQTLPAQAVPPVRQTQPPTQIQQQRSYASAVSGRDSFFQEQLPPRTAGLPHSLTPAGTSPTSLPSQNTASLHSPKSRTAHQSECHHHTWLDGLPRSSVPVADKNLVAAPSDKVPSKSPTSTHWGKYDGVDSPVTSSLQPLTSQSASTNATQQSSGSYAAVSPSSNSGTLPSDSWPLVHQQNIVSKNYAVSSSSTGPASSPPSPLETTTTSPPLQPSGTSSWINGNSDALCSESWALISQQRYVSVTSSTRSAHPSPSPLETTTTLSWQPSSYTSPGTNRNLDASKPQALIHQHQHANVSSVTTASPQSAKSPPSPRETSSPSLQPSYAFHASMDYGSPSQNLPTVSKEAEQKQGSPRASLLGKPMPYSFTPPSSPPPKNSDKCIIL
ncbi:nascent polypeptide-associated complex subunit alpha, muscle-specific form isoform X1 [Zootoca vivipara]|uniref:nascent polypeptide-associated complex subunit alpha, muscle-specific form isoform X1 n=2 Tax=Zootoca vivipara TaxID=8524 RepID=UPI00293C1308|nr:nascent polypeptide-associated complex subunit alpha, muscle-specific form isoform X1 [Zootoca vivipara]XP_034991759.2 nascent polypeptide-associated complex subunit alpha, muscle-specific form isoform X1 [Zootoca vivipara]